MLRPSSAILAGLAAGVLALGAAAAFAADPAPEDPGKVQTTPEVNQGSLEGAATAPLRDLNVLRTKIPQVLLDAEADPYARPPRLGRRPSRAAQCAQLVSLIQPLDEALGPDVDSPAPDASPGMADRGRRTAYGAMAAFASDAIPFRGWVRKLTGAERHDRFVQQAITAGAVRRGYLKGLGEANGCNPPATPSHVLTTLNAEAKAQDPRPQPPTPPRAGLHPRYPIR
jgi:hypothetical protein